MFEDLKNEIVSQLVSSNIVSIIGKQMFSKIEECINSKESLEEHKNFIINWASELSFTDLIRSKKTTDIFIHLDTYMYPISQRFSQIEEIEKKPLLEIVCQGDHHALISGQPGSGKTTSMKYLCMDFYNNPKSQMRKYAFPILIRVRDLNEEFEYQKKENLIKNRRIIYREIERCLGIRNLRSILADINSELKNQKEDEGSVEKEYVRKIHSILEKTKPFIIIEGLDEFFSYELRDLIVKDLSELTMRLSNSKIIITTRTGDVYFNFDRTDTFEISSLDNAQIAQFSKKWLLEKSKITHFIDEIKKSPYYDTTIKPLTLAHLCAIYERSGKIPDKPKSIYRKIVMLLIEEWDEQRLIKRKSKFSEFEGDRKLEFLSNIAYELSIRNRLSVFSLQSLEKIYKSICFNYDLDINEAKKVAKEIETHTGLFIECRYQSYEFVHKSIQEYLCAEYILKLPTLPNNHRIIKMLPNELAVAVSLSSNPSYYFSELVLRKLYNYKISARYISVFITRIVQEKTSFNSSNFELLLSFFALYTKYFNIINNDVKGQLFLIPIDPSFIEFENIVRNISKRNKLKNILKQYDFVESNDSSDDTLYILRKKTICPAYYPEIIYARKSFFQNEGNVTKESV